MPQKISYLVLDYNRPEEGEKLLLSLQKFANHDKEIVYLCNGGESDYAYEFYKQKLINTLIIKDLGFGGGWGQTDLWRCCKTEYAFFIQVDQELVLPIDEDIISKFIDLLNDYKCIDLNGDQSRRNVWTDRAHFMNSDFFNSLGPFPNFGPGLDNGKWNEQYLQEKFIENNYKIAHITPVFFRDNGKFSVREAGDGVFKHRCDTKQLWVIKQPTYKTEVYPPLNDLEWQTVLNGNWSVWGKDKEGRVPNAWKDKVFRAWD